GVSQTVLEVMAMRGVVIGSPTGAITPALHDGVDGLLAADAATAVEQLRRLHGDAALRARLGAAAHEAAARDWDIRARVDQLLALVSG
ncbi:MAG TPA: glycosyltransferase, partial [Acidimicrobiia bacterium]|nr:glycosyltransferase [Acidimicrobiia bacterium]